MLWTWRSVGDYSVTSALTPYLCAPGSAVSHGPFFSGHRLGPSHTQVSPCALPMDTWPFVLHFHSIHTCTHNRKLSLGKQRWSLIRRQGTHCWSGQSIARQAYSPAHCFHIVRPIYTSMPLFSCTSFLPLSLTEICEVFWRASAVVLVEFLASAWLL